MVNGLETFSTYFKDFTDYYILIGGAACDVQISAGGLNFRATKDLDLILIVEALSPEFVKKFWEFVKQGNYENRQKSQGERKYYRFLKPDDTDFPAQLELFARKPDFLGVSEDSHLTPLPVDDDISSLSAILMNDDYYKFTIDNSRKVNNLHLASVETLICLKARAFLDLKKRKESGESISEKEIRKHKNDVIRLAAMLSGGAISEVPESILTDMREFIQEIKHNQPDFGTIKDSLGLQTLDGDNLIIQIEQTFSL